MPRTASGLPGIYNASQITLTDGEGAAVALDVNGNQIVSAGGNVAAGVADSGNPVKVAGKYNATLPTLADGQRGDIQLNAKSIVKVAPVATFGANYNEFTMVGGGGDAQNGASALWVSGSLWNGVTYDRQRTNLDQTVGITAAGVTSTQTGADQVNYNHRGLKVVLDMTTVGTGSVTLEIDGKDNASGKYYALLTGAAVATNSTNVYTVYPGAVVTANVSANDVLPRQWRIKVTANNANATTYTVGASLIV